MHVEEFADPSDATPPELQGHQAGEPPTLVFGQAIEELLGLLTPIGVV
jgi:hypothetical protein